MAERFRAPPEIYEYLVKIGIQKVKLPIAKLLLLGIMAGIFIGIGSALFTTVTQGIIDGANIGYASLVGGIVFSVGLMLVVFAGAELFTGNNLMFIGMLDKKITIKELLRNWFFVYIGNFIGALILALLMYYGGLLDGAVGERALAIANVKVSLTFIQVLVRAILANFLVCLAIALASADVNEIGKIFGILFPIMAFVALGYEHSIANMYFLPAGILLGKSALLNWGTIFTKNLIVVTIGNIIGGAFLVGAVYWYAYVRKGNRIRD